MRRVLGAALLVVVAACGGGKLYAQIEVEPGKRVYEGMSSAEIKGVLGVPSFVSSSPSRKYEAEFMLDTIDPSWVEWAWHQSDGTILVAYMHGGIVQKLGKVSVGEG